MWDNEIVKEIFKVMTNCQVVSLMCHLKPTRRRLFIKVILGVTWS